MPKVSLKDTLKGLKTKIESFNDSITSSTAKYKNDLKELNEIIDEIHESWSGSWIGSHSNLYFREYKKPNWSERFDSEWGLKNGIPESWEEKTYEDISSFINIHYKGKNILEIEKFLHSCTEKVKELHYSLCTELSLIGNLENYEKETGILGEIENIEWGVPLSTYVKYFRPNQVITRDTRSLYQGIETPPHIEYRARVLSLLSTIDSIENFIKQSLRLIRQIEIKENFMREGTDILDSVSNILLICGRFHFVARQLRNRYNKRPTLEIDDEYDVQDLLHSLLRIFFNDVRPEEWTSSYAGGSSRIDFLLKEEKIVIEVKKTRKNLTDKEIGEQLIIDIAKYEQHPDCRTLICFIYDPEGRIGNPGGLSNDLNQLSNENMNIIAIIKPS